MSTGRPSSSAPSVQGSKDSLPGSSGEKERGDLLAKARAFLQSPAAISQDVAARREFLKEKGLDSEDIENLISECVSLSNPLNESLVSRTYNSLLQFHRGRIQGLLLRDFL
jgi:hypothetical protein